MHFGCPLFEQQLSWHIMIYPWQKHLKTMFCNHLFQGHHVIFFWVNITSGATGSRQEFTNPPCLRLPLQMERWMAAQDFNQKVLAPESGRTTNQEPEEMEPISLQAIKLVEASGGKTRWMVQKVGHFTCLILWRGECNQMYQQDFQTIHKWIIPQNTSKYKNRGTQKFWSPPTRLQTWN